MENLFAAISGGVFMLAVIGGVGYVVNAVRYARHNGFTHDMTILSPIDSRDAANKYAESL